MEQIHQVEWSNSHSKKLQQSFSYKELTCENIRTLESRSFSLGSNLSRRTILPANKILLVKKSDIISDLIDQPERALKYS